MRNDLRVLVAAIWGGRWLTLRWWGVTGLGSAEETARACWAVVTRMSQSVRLRKAWGGQRWRLGPAMAACGISDSPATRMMKSDSDTLVTAVAGRTGESVLKIATSAAADRNLARHADAVTRLRERCDPGFVVLLPRVLDRATVGDRIVVRETLLSGWTPDVDPGPAAAATISWLHMATARPLVVTPSLLAQWVNLPAAIVLGLDLSDRHAAAINRIADYLREGLIDKTVIASCTHGDYRPGNVLLSHGHSRPMVTGIVDWENFMDPGIPDADPVHWYLTTRPVHLGAAVCGVLDDPGQLDRYFESVGASRPNPHIGSQRVVLFAWMWHVANTRTRATRNGPGRIWLARSVHPVLHRFSSDTPSVPGRLSARHS